MIKCQDPKVVHQSTKEIAATWLALGLDPTNVTFYRQSDIPEIPQLCWYLMCVAPKGLMNRAHAYKDAVQKILILVKIMILEWLWVCSHIQF